MNTIQDSKKEMTVNINKLENPFNKFDPSKNPAVQINMYDGFIQHAKYIVTEFEEKDSGIDYSIMANNELSHLTVFFTRIVVMAVLNYRWNKGVYFSSNMSNLYNPIEENKSIVVNLTPIASLSGITEKTVSSHTFLSGRIINFTVSKYEPEHRAFFKVSKKTQNILSSNNTSIKTTLLQIAKDHRETVPEEFLELFDEKVQLLKELEIPKMYPKNDLISSRDIFFKYAILQDIGYAMLVSLGYL